MHGIKIKNSVTAHAIQNFHKRGILQVHLKSTFLYPQNYSLYTYAAGIHKRLVLNKVKA